MFDFWLRDFSGACLLACSEESSAQVNVTIVRRYALLRTMQVLSVVEELENIVMSLGKHGAEIMPRR